MIINQTTTFKRAAKKLHENQKEILKEKIKDIQSDPEIGEMKIGDLAGVRVYKFQVVNQLMLLAYKINEIKTAGKKETELTLLSFGVHENFYKNLKK